MLLLRYHYQVLYHLQLVNLSHFFEVVRAWMALIADLQEFCFLIFATACFCHFWGRLVAWEA